MIFRTLLAIAVLLMPTAALAGEVFDIAPLGSQSLMAAVVQTTVEGMPALRVAYINYEDVLGILTPENALVLTSMDDFRRLMRLAGYTP